MGKLKILRNFKESCCRLCWDVWGGCDGLFDGVMMIVELVLNGRKYGRKSNEIHIIVWMRIVVVNE